MESFEEIAIEQHDSTEGESDNESRIPVPIEEEEQHHQYELDFINLFQDKTTLKLNEIYYLNWKNIDSKILTPPPKFICV